MNASNLVKLENVQLEAHDGKGINVKSQYYKQLNRYTRSVIRALNKNPSEEDRTYYLTQLELSFKEMNYVQDKFFNMFCPSIDK